MTSAATSGRNFVLESKAFKAFRHRLGRFVQNLVREIAAVKRRLACQQFVESGAQRVKISSAALGRFPPNCCGLM